MVIAIDGRSLLRAPQTGVGTYTVSLISTLLDECADAEIVLFACGARIPSDLPFQDHSRVTWVRLRVPNKVFHLVLWLCGRPHIDRLVAKKSNKQIDTWISPNLHFSAISKQQKHVLTIHDLSFVHYTDMYSRKSRLWHAAVRPKKKIEAADIVLVPSEHTRRDIVNTYGVHDAKIHVLTPGYTRHVSTADDRERLFRILQKEHQLPDRFFLYLGTLEPRKNISGLLDAYTRSPYLKKHMPIVFVGALGLHGSRYKKMIASSPGAYYIGYVSEEEKYALLSHTHAFVYPSLYEGFGLPVLEALGSGIPVIASDRTSLPSLVGDAGIVINPYNDDALRRAMEQLVEDPIRYARYTAAAHAHATTYSWGQSVQTLLSLIS